MKEGRSGPQPTLNAPVTDLPGGERTFWRKSRAGAERQDAMQRAMAESNPAQRARLWGALAGHVVSPGAESALRTLTQAEAIPSPSLREEFCQAVCARWAESDAPGAMDAMKELADAETQRTGTLAILRVWTERDLEGSLQWLARKSDLGSLPGEAGGILVAALQREEPLTVLALLENSGAGHQHRELYGPFLDRLEERDYAAAAAALMKSSSAPMQTLMGSQFIVSWGRQSPMEAATWVASLPPGDAQGRAVEWVVTGWSVSDPQGAARWVEGFPEGRVREQAVEMVLPALLARDEASAAAWLASLTPGRSREMGVSTFCDQLAFLDSDTALRRVGAIQDEELLRAVQARMRPSTP